MEISVRKNIWWFVLLSSGVMALFLLLVMLTTYEPIWPFFLVEAFLCGFAYVQLKVCYREAPRRPLRFRFALADLLTIVVVFGLLLTVFRWFSSSDENYLYNGLPSAIVLGIGFAIALIYTATDSPTFALLPRCILATAYLVASLTYIGLGIMAQICLIAVVAVAVVIFR